MRLTHHPHTALDDSGVWVTRISDVKVSGGFDSVALSMSAIAAVQLPTANGSYISRPLVAHHTATTHNRRDRVGTYSSAM